MIATIKLIIMATVIAYVYAAGSDGSSIHLQRLFIVVAIEEELCFSNGTVSSLIVFNS